MLKTTFSPTEPADRNVARSSPKLFHSALTVLSYHDQLVGSHLSHSLNPPNPDVGVWNDQDGSSLSDSGMVGSNGIGNEQGVPRSGYDFFRGDRRNTITSTESPACTPGTLIVSTCSMVVSSRIASILGPQLQIMDHPLEFRGI